MVGDETAAVHMPTMGHGLGRSRICRDEACTVWPIGDADLGLYQASEVSLVRSTQTNIKAS